jgi:hypothetical protein
MAPHAREWLNTATLSAVGLHMSDDVIKLATDLRLDANLCVPHTYLCEVDARGIRDL